MIKLILVFVFCFITSILCSNLEHDGWLTVKLQHALNDGSHPIYTDRGNISIQSLRSGQAITTQNPLSPEESKLLRDLAQNNRLYHLKSVVVANDGTETTFISSIKACMLAESKLDDRISISLDYSGKVIGIAIVIASKSTCEGATVPTSQLKEFTTSVYVRHTEAGPIPDTASYIQKLERERESKERGDVKDNRSFLAKYWMYIVPVVILMMVSSMANPEASAGGGR